MSKGFYSVSRGILDESARQSLIEGIVQSEFLGDSVLGDEFVRTFGFSLVFRRDGLPALLERFHFMAPLLSAALFEGCNAFYVNPLVLHGDSRVDPHIDCRLITPGDIRIVPNVVSVYYAEVSPHMVGGGLVMNVGAENEVVFVPSSGELVHFLGSTIHRVQPVCSRHRRISVVCEQYHLEGATLERFPVCDVLASVMRDQPAIAAIHRPSFVPAPR